VSRGRFSLALLLLLAACTCPSRSPPPVDADAWFVEVGQEGGCWIEPETLQGIGIDPMQDSFPALRLSWADREMPYLPLRTGAGWGLFFFAPDRSTRYSRRTAFLLEPGLAGEKMPLEEPTSAASAPAGGLISQSWEEDHRYLPQAAAEIPWFWEPVYAPGAVTHTVTLPDALPGPLTVTLRLWSHTAAPAAPDHLLRLRWDGRTVGQWEWDGQGMQHLSASWSEQQPLKEHTLVVETPAPPGVDVALVWLDGWQATYRRGVAPSGTVWRAEAGSMRLEEADSGARLLDVTDPFAPRDLGSVPADGLVGTTPGRRYWVGRPDLAPGPLAVRAAEWVDLDALEGVTYLALAPSEFQDPLRPLLEHRQGQGLTTAVVDPQAVYDTFGRGRPDPEAVRELVQSAPSLRYLLLVGDGTAEPWGYDGEPGALRVVVPLTRTAVLGETPADGLLGTDEEGRPAVAVGRFPANSARQVAAMVEKTIRWETQEDPPAALLLNDDEAEFVALIEEIASLLPTRMQAQRLDVGDEESRAELLAALNGGPVWLNYNGHGSLTLLGDEGVLTLEDGEVWREPALVVTWTCLAAHFIHPAQDSMAETWLRARGGGAVAFLGPVGETTTSEQEPFARAFYRALARGDRLGDAWLAALQGQGARDVRWGYTLLGDPALRLVGD